MTTPTSDPWTIILAAGDGTRLRSLTRALHGEEVPKQFAEIQPGRSLLQATVARASRWSRSSRTLVVVAKERLDLARSQLARFPGVRVVAQPKNLGTGPGVLLPLAHVVAEDPSSHVVIVPSDHYVRDSDVFAGTILRAEARSRTTGSVVLVGAVPDRADTQYGWIVPAPGRCESELDVARFSEKPAASDAKKLLRTGALWSTFIIAGSAEQLWGLGRRHLPGQFSELDSYRAEIGAPTADDTLARIYQRIVTADFSREVLEQANGLGVVALPPCGWSDWGTPWRVLESLRKTAHFAMLSRRLEATLRGSRDGENATALALAALAS